MKNGTPRVVQYLPYPCDYGKIPHARADGGDLLDIVILAPALPRGSVVKANVIGVMKYTDKGDRDSKIVAVMENTPLVGVVSVA